MEAKIYIVLYRIAGATETQEKRWIFSLRNFRG